MTKLNSGPMRRFRMFVLLVGSQGANAERRRQASFLPAVIGRFVDAHPRVAVSLEMRSESTIQRWVSSGHCDVGFATITPDAFGVTSVELYTLAGLCALPARHALAARERIGAADLRGERLILPSYADDTRTALVTRGTGVGIVNPLATVDADPARIVFRQFAPEIWFRGFTLYPQTPQANPVVEAFLELVHEDMADFKVDEQQQTAPCRERQTGDGAR